MDFGKYCSLYNVLTLFLQIKKYNQTFYKCLHSSNIFRAYIMLTVKLEHDLQNYMTYKTRHVISNYHVGMLTNHINPTPKPNSSSGVASKQTLRILWSFSHSLGFSCFLSTKLTIWYPSIFHSFSGDLTLTMLSPVLTYVVVPWVD